MKLQQDKTPNGTYQNGKSFTQVDCIFKTKTDNT